MFTNLAIERGKYGLMTIKPPFSHGFPMVFLGGTTARRNPSNHHEFLKALQAEKDAEALTNSVAAWPETLHRCFTLNGACWYP